MLTVNYPFTTSGNYTFDAAKVTITGGKTQLLDLRQTDATFGVTYTNNINGRWGGGVLAGTASGGAAVSGGKLDLAHNDVRYVSYDANLNADNQQTGAIRFRVTPNYSGNPGAGQVFLIISKAAGDNDNLIQIQHSAAGQFRSSINDSAGAGILSVSWGAWAPTAGTEYEIELNWDITSGATRIFIDGIQLGVTDVSTGTRDASIALLRIGSDATGALVSNFEMNDILIFSTVQHTANYTAGYTVSETIYVTDNPTITPVGHINTDGLLSFTTTVTEPGSDTITHILEVDGVDTYWDGAAWSASTGFAQSNTAADINTNAAALGISSGAGIFVKSYLHSNDGSTTPDIDIITVGYNFFGPADAAPEECIVFGYLLDPFGDAVSGATVTARLQNSAFATGVNYLVLNNEVSATTSSSGYFELSLIKSNQFTPNLTYDFVIQITDGLVYYNRGKTIPDATSVEFDDL